ncbi:MAG: hypothetical protein MK098_03930 [Marinovum sp.]|nr:hypothetical protein [Marinovum sp.]
MAGAFDIETRAASLAELVREKVGSRGSDLAVLANKAGRRLPKRVRADMVRLAEALQMAHHPKLSRQLDWAELRRAFDRVTEHLETLDPADRRKGARLSWLGNNVFNLIVVFVLLILVLWWRGLV